ncbi:unnamed protein product [Urochloa humidicola]
MAPAGTMGREEELELPMDAGAADKLRQAGVLGIVTCAMAFSLAVRDDPPPRLDKDAYFLALSGAFFAGVAEIITAVFISNNNPPARHAAGRKLVYASVGSLAVVVGLSAASFLL